MPSEAVFSSFPLASSLTSEQLRALEKTYDSAIDGQSFLEAWSSQNRVNATQHYGSETAVTPHVRFQEDDNPFPRREDSHRNVWDTPIVPNINSIRGVQPVQMGRFSDASSGYSGGSANSSGIAARPGLSDQSMPTPRGNTPTVNTSSNEHQVAPASNATREDRVETGRQPANETYTINTGRRREHNQTGQYIFVPDDAPEDAAHNFSGGVTGKYVFIPYDDPDPWRLMRNDNRGTPIHDAPPTRTRSVGPIAAQPNQAVNNRVSYADREAAPNSFPRLRSRIQPIHDWKLNFSGEEKLVSPTDLIVRINEFLYQIEINKHARRISDEEMLGRISSLLTGSARTWYYAYYRSFRDWEHFVEAMRKRFLSQYHELDALDEISQRKQGKTEPVMTYLKMVMLFQTVSEGLNSNIWRMSSRGIYDRNSRHWWDHGSPEI